MIHRFPSSFNPRAYTGFFRLLQCGRYFLPFVAVMGICVGCATPSKPDAHANPQAGTHRNAPGATPAAVTVESPSVSSTVGQPVAAAIPAAASSSNEPPPGASYRVTNGGFIASPSEELLSKAISYAAAQDAGAFQQIMRTGLVIELKEGLKVQIVDTKLFHGLVKIRPFGSTLELWTPMEALKDAA